MKITNITPQVKNPSRYSVFVDEKYAFSLSADALLAAGLTRGQELSQVELTDLKKASQDDKTYNLTLAYVARRMRSEGELQDYFRRKQFAPELTRTVLVKLQGLGLVDDEEFARRWVANRRLLKATSAKKLRLELRQKHISNDVIRQVLETDETDDRQVLRQLVEKKQKLSRYSSDPQKLLRYLAGQGFNYDDIKAVLNEEDSI